MRNFKARAEITEKILQTDMPCGDENLGSLVLQMILPRDGQHQYDDTIVYLFLF